MKKIRLILSALLIMLCANMAANAATIGYADFEKVLSDYSYARTAFKDLDNKITELQQYAIEGIKSIDPSIAAADEKEEEEKEESQDSTEVEIKGVTSETKSVSEVGELDNSEGEMGE